MANEAISNYDITEQFEKFLYDTVELREPVNLILDGEKHRIALKGDKSGEKSGEYRIYTDRRPAGYVKDYRSGLFITWSFNFESIKDSQPELYKRSKTKEFKAEAERARQERAAKEAQERREATLKTKAEFDAATPATDEHEYLIKKHVRGYGLKVGAFNNLLVPLQDADGNFKTMQRINTQGGKLFAGGCESTGVFHIINATNLRYREPCIIAEGYATAATIYECLSPKYPEYQVIAAMNCGNLKAVCEAVKKKAKPRFIIIMADNDAKTKINTGHNPGLDKAFEVRKAGLCDGVFYPDFSQSEQEAKKTDWNDYCEIHGRDATTKELERIIVKFLSKQDALTGSEFLDVHHDQKWLIKHWIPENSSIMMFGASGSGKSLSGVDMALSIATPEITDWYGYSLKHGSVFYFAGEGHDGLGKRIRGFRQTNLLFNEFKNFYITQKPLPVDTPDGVQNAIDIINRFNIPDLKLIVIDTLNRHMAGDENSAFDARKVMNAAAELQEYFQASVMIVHHTGVSDEAKNRARGSSAFKGAMDVELLVREERDYGQGVFSISQTKNKDGKAQDAIYFKKQTVELDNEFDEDGEPVDTVVLVPFEISAGTKKLKVTGNKRVALETYIRAAQATGTFTADNNFYGVRLERWRDEFYKKITADTDSGKRSNFLKARNALTENNTLFIEVNETGDIYRPDSRFYEVVAAAGLKNELEKIKPTSRSELFSN